MGEKKGKYIECEYCGKTVYKTLTNYNRREHHFCSNKCQGAWRREQAFESRNCEICGKSFYVSKKSKQRFCSPECQKEWQKTNTGYNNPKFRGGYLVCENCGRKFLVGKSTLESSRHHFCSTECRRQWYAEVWAQQDEWKEASRKRAAALLSANKTTTQTKPQVKFNELLDSLGIEYINEKVFDFYSVDNYLSKDNLIVEVMGDFWHASPLLFDPNINKKAKELREVQKKSVLRDKAKHTFIKKYYGIEILYLWESDILKNIDMCRALVLEYINNEGALKNYNSFNYSLEEGALLLKERLITPFQEIKIAC